jgi:MFS family permease
MATVIVIIYFAEKDISIATTTLVIGIGASPWMFKFIFGPVTDYFIKFGRKKFIIFGGILASICLIILTFIDSTDMLVVFTILLFISHSGTMFLDVSSDGWAIQTAKPIERGKINGAMSTGLWGGVAISSILLTYISDIVNFQMVFFVAGLFVLSPVVLTFFVKEEIIIKKPQKIISLLLFEFKKNNTILVLLFGGISAINFGMLMLIIPDYMKNILLLQNFHIGLISSLFPISIIIGAIIGGFICDRYGRKITLSMFLILLAGSSISFIFVESWEMLAIVYSFVGFIQGGSLYSALLALYMDNTNPRIGASQYSIFTSFSNFGEIGFALFSGSLLVMLGYTKYFLYAAWTVGLALLILYLIKDIRK